MRPNLNRFSRPMPWEAPEICYDNDNDEYNPEDFLADTHISDESRDPMSQENSKPQTQQKQNTDTKTSNP